MKAGDPVEKSLSLLDIEYVKFYYRERWPEAYEELQRDVDPVKELIEPDPLNVAAKTLFLGLKVGYALGLQVGELRGS